MAKKRQAANSGRKALLKKVAELGEAFGRLDALVEEFDRDDLRASELFENAAFPYLEKMVTRLAGKSAMRSFIAGGKRGMSSVKVS